MSDDRRTQSSNNSVTADESRKMKLDIMKELIDKCKDDMKDTEKLNEAAEHLLSSLIDNVIFGTVLELSFDYEAGKLSALDGEDSDPGLKSLEKSDNSIFGDKNNKKPIDCHCPNCQTKVAASRFAPHLEKCMGMGRNSSRIASRRIAARENSNSNSNHSSLHGSDDDDDAEWSGEKRRKKISGRGNTNGKKNGK